MVVFLFPGQGSQSPGMAKDLYDEYEGVKALFSKADEACGMDMKGLLFDGTADELKATENSQPAIVLASLAVREALRAEGFESSGAAGHSLGEYSALVDAGVLTADDALRAVTARGKLMAEAGAGISSEKGENGMAAVLGIGPEAVREALDGYDDVWTANENGPTQVVIAGTKAGMDAAADALKAAGARRTIPLKVSGPFHTPLMAGMSESLEKVLRDFKFSDPVKSVWSNVTAAVVKSGDDARNLLVKQVTHPVRWVEIMASIASASPSAIYESGPGKVLTGLWNKSGNSGTCLPAGTLGDLNTIKENR